MDVCENMAGGQLLFIGLGLYSEKDISLNGLSEIKQCDKFLQSFIHQNLSVLKKIVLSKLLENK